MRAPVQTSNVIREKDGACRNGWQKGKTIGTEGTNLGNGKREL